MLRSFPSRAFHQNGIQERRNVSFRIARVIWPAAVATLADAFCVGISALIAMALTPGHDPAAPSVAFVAFTIIALSFFGPFIFIANTLLARKLLRDVLGFSSASLVSTVGAAIFGGYALLLVRKWPLSSMLVSNTWVFAIAAFGAYASFATTGAWIAADRRRGIR